MTYSKLLEAIDSGEEDVIEFCKEDVLVPCLNGRAHCDVQTRLSDTIVTSDDYLKPELATIDKFEIARTSQLEYSVHVNATYRDTLASVEDGVLLKCMVTIAIAGDVSPNVSAYDAMVFIEEYDTV